MKLSKMPVHAADVMATIRWWQKQTGRGATLLDIQCTNRDGPTAARRGLTWLKRRRLVSWTPEGNVTRYSERKAS